ncbi:hypothetical protein L249_4668 [Ophiocordyceps polyrhachis-furcata BCC 54312]|uniref:Mitochondrial intermembrane space import and assembly protein 40 n=1 Tax=Ophiocordyceps polyrhachis-furcata BCC 54312 TaxID=1330021 RepID=A0A367L2L5_9HYPO|nr:hypothetical protein L249_4668 [Ophiocordyceps polyrhachis-furcata BCC 54312]
MFCAAVARSASRAVPRAMTRCGPQRLASTLSPASRSRTIRGSLVRWALALGAVYYYNTSPVFADEVDAEPTIPATSPFPGPEPNTVDAVVEQKRKQARAAVLSDRQQQSSATGAKTEALGEATAPGSTPASEEDEDDGGQGGAFNPETGEINWDCPCLGGMAHGPCGEQFRAAFSCFVYSNEEPKGMDCIEKFQYVRSMQDCFREHPDVYGAELEDDELPEEAAMEAPAAGRNATPEREEPSRDGRGSSVREAAATGQDTARGSDKSSAENEASHVMGEDGKRAKTVAEKDIARKVDADAKPSRYEVTAESHADAPWRDASVTNGADARKGS